MYENKQRPKVSAQDKLFALKSKVILHRENNSFC